MKYSKAFLIFIVSLSAFFAACSAKKEIHGDDYMIVPNSWSIQQASLVCKMGSKCDGSVGVLFHVERFQEDNGDKKIRLGRCTAWLVAPDVVATNSHCVKYQQQGDLSYTWFKLPNDAPVNGQYVAVKSILRASTQDDVKTHVDYAYLQLESSIQAPIIPIDQSGILPDELLDIHVVNQSSEYSSDDALSWQLEHFKCKASQDSFFQEGVGFYSHHYYMALVGANSDSQCRSISGNSGSPVLSKNGAAKGIVYLGLSEKKETEKSMGYFQQELKDPIEKYFNGLNIKYNPSSNYRESPSGRYNYVGLSNFACIPDLKAGTVSKDCRITPLKSIMSFPKMGSAAKNEFFQRLSLAKEYKKWIGSEVDVNGIRWKPSIEYGESSGGENFVKLMTPVCFLPSPWSQMSSPSLYFDQVDNRFQVRTPLTLTYDQNLEVHFDEKSFFSSASRWDDFFQSVRFDVSEKKELKGIILKRSLSSRSSPYSSYGSYSSSSSEQVGKLPSEIYLKPCAITSL